ncbi:MAG: hypothetical protein KGL18_16260 [Burkholderiales bacterium]|nr:hypothetical protein [Burkholderiales bacterium]MDE1927308.1 hypothetical protein [Burkholderiales bacterium]MDE2159980.1 hypothetical protein [Burkholderiales bacterium]MDE2504519.1 hypothetical protein [Burkholderiales bacterium]
MKSTVITAALAALLGLGACAGAHAGAHAGTYAVVQKYRLGGAGGWDYLSFDAAGRRLFISRGTHVQVVDAQSGKIVGDIPDTPGVHGIALAHDLGKGYISNGAGNSVTVFSLADLHVIATVATPDGSGPDFIAYDAASRQVLAFNGRSRNATVIDAATDRPVATIALAGKPEAAAGDGAGRMFVNIEDRSEIAVIDLVRHAVVATWPVAGCDEPSALSIDRAHHRLYAGCHNRTMAVVDSRDGHRVALLPIGAGVDANAYDERDGLVFSSQGDGSLTIVEQQAPDRYAVLQNVATVFGARTMALDAAHHRVYLVTADLEPAAAASAGQRQRRKAVPDSFTLIVVAARP